MKIYEVGGAVRDELLGLTPKDRDYVVVGSTPEEMLSLGYKQVGANFPVFLHPETGDEYALARTEESTGQRYQDFDCYFGKDVTIEQDLERRDLTINAIAKDIDTGELIDPFYGVDDIKRKMLRQTSVAFAEDALRVLRLARFWARFGKEWTIHPDTITLCNQMYKQGLLESLTPERVWIETQKALQTKTPSLYFRFLFKYNIFPEITDMWNCPQRTDHHPEVEYTKDDLFL